MTHRINFLDKYYIVGIDSCGLETLRGFGFVPHVKALNINWCARLQQLAQLTPCVLGIARLAPLDTTWCTASGSPIKPEGLQCTSHCVDTRGDTTLIQPEDELTITDRAIIDHVRRMPHARGCTHLINS